MRTGLIFIIFRLLPTENGASSALLLSCVWSNMLTVAYTLDTPCLTLVAKSGLQPAPANAPDGAAPPPMNLNELLRNAAVCLSHATQAARAVAEDFGPLLLLDPDEAGERRRTLAAELRALADSLEPDKAKLVALSNRLQGLRAADGDPRLVSEEAHELTREIVLLRRSIFDRRAAFLVRLSRELSAAQCSAIETAVAAQRSASGAAAAAAADEHDKKAEAAAQYGAVENGAAAAAAVDDHDKGAAVVAGHFVDPFAYLDQAARRGIVCALVNHYQLQDPNVRCFMQSLQAKSREVRHAAVHSMIAWMFPRNMHEVELLHANGSMPIDVTSELSCVYISHRAESFTVLVPPFFHEVEIAHSGVTGISVMHGAAGAARPSPSQVANFVSRARLEDLPQLTGLHLPCILEDLQIFDCPQLPLLSEEHRHLFQRLSVLALEGMHLTDQTLAQLVPLLPSTLAALSLANNEQITVLPDLAQRTPALHHLLLHNCTGLVDVATLGRLGKLSQLNLSRTGVAVLPEECPPVLEALSLSYTAVVALPARWRTLCLRHLYISGTPLLSQLLPNCLSELWFLVSDNAGLTNEQLAAVPFAMMTQLHMLSIAGNPLVSALPASVAAMPALRTLVLNGMPLLREFALPPMLFRVKVGPDSCGLLPKFCQQVISQRGPHFISVCPLADNEMDVVL